ncbi:unnamed protein product [Gadus morhua 'NCC']
MIAAVPPNSTHSALLEEEIGQLGWSPLREDRGWLLGPETRSEDMGEAQSRSRMLHVQDPAQGPAFEGRGRGPVGGTSSSPSSSSSLQNRKHDKDSNFNFLPPGGKSDENRNQNQQGRPRNLSPLGRDHQSSGPPPPPGPPSSPSHHLLSPLSRLPCWSPLEPLPEIESGDDSSGRVPPDGAEERGPPTPETGAPPRLGGGPAPKGPVMTAAMMKNMNRNNEKERVREDQRDDEERVRELEDDDEWGDSGSDLELSYRSGGSVSSLNLQSGEDGGGGVLLPGPWDRMGVGQPKAPPTSRSHAPINPAPSAVPPGPPTAASAASVHASAERGAANTQRGVATNDRGVATTERGVANKERGVAPTTRVMSPPSKHDRVDDDESDGQRPVAMQRRPPPGGRALPLHHLIVEEEDEEDEDGEEEEEEEEEERARRQSSDSEGEPLLDTAWTLRERERFKAQEMERHQVQLTMYRRLALIRWVRTLQGHVAGQQDRLQASFDVVLTHRKELLRMGAAAAATGGVAGGVASAAAPPPVNTAVVGQS